MNLHLYPYDVEENVMKQLKTVGHTVQNRMRNVYLGLTLKTHMDIDV